MKTYLKLLLVAMMGTGLSVSADDCQTAQDDVRRCVSNNSRLVREELKGACGQEIKSFIAAYKSLKCGKLQHPWSGNEIPLNQIVQTLIREGRAWLREGRADSLQDTMVRKDPNQVVNEAFTALEIQ
ncbi:MAG: hypothetical protein AB7G93_09020 [Bdellovibrionales bacterium]